MVNWIATWILPIAILLTALAAFFTAVLTRKQLYWDKAPIIEIKFIWADKLVEGPHLQNKPNMILEWLQWNESAKQQDKFLIAQFKNQQTDKMGVAAKVKFKALFSFPNSAKPGKGCRKTWPFGRFWLAPSETYLVVVANLRGVPTASIDIKDLEWYDMYGMKHTEAYGYCCFNLAPDGKMTGEFKVL